MGIFCRVIFILFDFYLDLVGRESLSLFFFGCRIEGFCLRCSMIDTELYFDNIVCDEDVERDLVFFVFICFSVIIFVNFDIFDIEILNFLNERSYVDNVLIVLLVSFLLSNC